MTKTNGNGKSLESWIWDAACSIRGAKDAPKYKDYILPLVFTKRLCDVFDDEVNRIDFNATTHGQRDLDDNRLSNLIEAEARESDKALSKILKQFGVAL
ncbi:MAG: type I restriction-modification system subunit M N-terminal domain-containing protein [Bacteroidota bacterium]